MVHEPNKNYKCLLFFYKNYFNILIKMNNGNYFFYIINVCSEYFYTRCTV